ncbi:6-pyruvoyl-tetrahydropterin synthase-related protein [Syntrophomonas curvata]
MENFNEALEKNAEAGSQFAGAPGKSHSSPDNCCESNDATTLPVNNDCEKAGPFIDHEDTGDAFADGDKNYSVAEQQASYITMKIVAFLNARHYMVFADKKGKTHGHSWQLQAEARVPVKYDSFVKFEDLDKLLNKLLAPYQRNILNEVSPFDIIEPLTENISVYFFNSLSDALENLDVNLVRLTVWENPTKGIEIAERLPQFFSSQEKKPVPAAIPKEALNEAAVSLDKEAPAPENQPDSGQSTDQVVNPIASEKEDKTEGTGNITPASNNLIDEPDGNHSGLAQGEDYPGAGQPQGLLTSLRLRLKSQDISIEEEAKRPSYPLWKIIVAIMVISGVAIWAYWPLLNAPLYKIYPWGSDTWGHLFKAEFLYRQIVNGNYYPQFMPDWYNGCQPFRYWPPLSYYILVLIKQFTSNIFVANNCYIFLCALLGGISCLALTRKIGFYPALLMGIIWVIWPDNVRIALSEGNLPRILATALLPLLFVFFMNTVKNKKQIRALIGTILIIHLVVLSHVMISAVYCICLVMFAVLWWLFGGCTFYGVIRGIGALLVGILSSAWWLLPSLQGGITGMDAAASAGGIQYTSAWLYFNPIFRLHNKEIFYWGIALLLVTVVSLIKWRSKPAWAKSLIIVGIFLVLLTFPSFSWLHQLLPLNHILWPLRFSTFFAFALISAGLAFDETFLKVINPGERIMRSLLMGLLFIVLLTDSFLSLPLLIGGREEPQTIIQCANNIHGNEGWREATMDLSSLGSAPAYFFSEYGKRDQVFGWAWQGATTAPQIMLLNTAINKSYYPYLFKRLVYLGATDIVVKDNSISSVADFEKLANQAGYQRVSSSKGLTYWNRAVGPYMVRKNHKCLAIGKHASIYALQFPSIEVGSSTRIDDYDLSFLKKYPIIILSGANWHLQRNAEKLVLDYARRGGRVIVDLTSFPKDVLSRQSKFLEVYAEPVELHQRLMLETRGGMINLEPFDNTSPGWKTHSPQGLDGIEMSFNHMGNKSALYGFKEIDGSKVWFLGANLAYHGFLTKDMQAQNILKNIINISELYEESNIIPFKEYKVNSTGYHLEYNIQHAEDIILPIAALDTFKVKINGIPVKTFVFENLIGLNLPGGDNLIDLEIKPTSVYLWGKLFSVLSVGFLALYLTFVFKSREREEKVDVQAVDE